MIVQNFLSTVSYFEKRDYHLIQHIALGKLSKPKSGETLERVQIGGKGGRQIKKFQFSVGKSSKSTKFQSISKTKRIMTHFHLMRTQKHKILVWKASLNNYKVIYSRNGGISLQIYWCTSSLLIP